MGNSGLWVSAIGLGCNNFGMRLDARQSAEVVHAALDAGITFFDTAESYGRTDHIGASEEYLAKGLGSHRDEVVVATKFGSPKLPATYPPGGSRRYLVRAVEDSLRRLETDWIDLYYLHYWDAATPIDETLAALDDLVRAGKVHYLGISNLAAWQLVEAHHRARATNTSPFTAVQIEWSLLRRDVEDEMVPAADHVGAGVVPFFPLASGLLTGKYETPADLPAGSRFAALPGMATGYGRDDWQRAAKIAEWARFRGYTPAEVALAWLASQPSVGSVIAGATTPEQVAANAAADDMVLSNDELLDLAAF